MDSDQYKTQNLDDYADWFLNSDILKNNEYSVDLYPYEKLFSQYKLNQLVLKNRIVYHSSPDYNLADQMGRPGTPMLDYYTRLAKGGVGLITTGSVPVSGSIDPTVIDKNGRSVYPQIIDNQSALAGWSELAETCRVFSASLFMTLSAGLGQQGKMDDRSDQKGLKSLFRKRPVSASGGKSFSQNIKCRRLSERDLEQIIDNFGEAAKTVSELGMAGVLIEGGRDELLAQMSNPIINQRKFGSFTNYQTFGLEIVRRIRRVNGPNFPILYSLELDPLNLDWDFVKNLIQAGIDGLLIRYGVKDYSWLAKGVRTLPAGYNLRIAETVRQYLLAENILSHNGSEIALILSGKLDFPDVAERALANELGDLVCFDDALLADPEWANKVYCGQIEQIRPAIDSIPANQKNKSSSVNPSIDYRSEASGTLTNNLSKKKIAVVGAGLAGIECAVTAFNKGHEVWLFEQENKIGGRLNKTLIPNFRMDLSNYLSWQQRRVYRLAESYPDFHLVLNVIATMSMLEERNFDTIVLANGGKPKQLAFDNSADLIDIFDLDFSDKTESSLLEQLNIVEKNKIIIFGEHPLALDIAYNLVYAYDKKVSLLFEGEEKTDLEYNWESQHLLFFLKQKNVDIYYNVTLKELNEDQISFQSTAGRYTLLYDFLFKATGLEPNPDLFELLYQYKIAPQVYQVGDCSKPGSIANNVRSGYRLGINL